MGSLQAPAEGVRRGGKNCMFLVKNGLKKSEVTG